MFFFPPSLFILRDSARARGAEREGDKDPKGLSGLRVNVGSGHDLAVEV